MPWASASKRWPTTTAPTLWVPPGGGARPLEGVQITPVGVSSGGELGPEREPHDAASQCISVLVVVPMVTNGTDGAVIHLGARWCPPARGA